MIGSGNYMVDQHEADRSFHRSGRSCHKCDGTGTIPWDQVDDAKDVRRDDLFFTIRRIRKYREVNFAEMRKIAKIIKNAGMDCPYCNGSGAL